jgi:hypothetical protein
MYCSIEIKNLFIIYLLKESGQCRYGNHVLSKTNNHFYGFGTRNIHFFILRCVLFCVTLILKDTLQYKRHIPHTKSLGTMVLFGQNMASICSLATL